MKRSAPQPLTPRDWSLAALLATGVIVGYLGGWRFLNSRSAPRLSRPGIAMINEPQGATQISDTAPPISVAALVAAGDLGENVSAVPFASAAEPSASPAARQRVTATQESTVARQGLGSWLQWLESEPRRISLADLPEPPSPELAVATRPTRDTWTRTDDTRGSLESEAPLLDLDHLLWADEPNPRTEPESAATTQALSAEDREALGVPDFHAASLNQEEGGPRVARREAPPAVSNPAANTGGTPAEFQPSRPLAPPSAVAASPLGNQIVGGPASSQPWATEPKIGDKFPHQPRSLDPRGTDIPPQIYDFDPGPSYESSFDPAAEMKVYEGKELSATQRPLIELGRPWYQLGPLAPPGTWLGQHNPVNHQFIVFGDSRIAAASNQNSNQFDSLLAVQTNLFFDWKLTGTERFNVFASPLTRGLDSTRYVLDDGRFVEEANFNIINGFFEGDLGALWGGLSNQTLPFDLPFAAGIMPLLFQNGVWMDDNILGVAVTIPARNIPAWNVSNMDVTFFAGYDNVDSPAFGNDNNTARIYGIANFIEAWNGYVELDYAFLDDRFNGPDRSYHNIGLAYTRRWGRFLSNSTRVIVNAGQDTVPVNTADGVLLLSENSLITSSPSNIVPYFNMFAGFDRPQSAARNGLAGGVLRNTGILFETDNLTGYPTLDASAQNTFGAALGLNLISASLNQQLVLEAAALGVQDAPINRLAAGPQYGLGMRYQLPLTHSVIFRADAMYGFLDNDRDINGLRVELRKKF